MTASWSAAYAPHGSPVSSGPVDWPALRWSIAIIRYCPAYAVSGLIAAFSQSGALERIPPGASVSRGNPVPCSVYQIFASPRSTYGTRTSSRAGTSVTQPMAGPPAATDCARRDTSCRPVELEAARLRDRRRSADTGEGVADEHVDDPRAAERGLQPDDPWLLGHHGADDRR